MKLLVSHKYKKKNEPRLFLAKKIIACAVLASHDASRLQFIYRAGEGILIGCFDLGFILNIHFFVIDLLSAAARKISWTTRAKSNYTCLLAIQKRIFEYMPIHIMKHLFLYALFIFTHKQAALSSNILRKIHTQLIA